MSVVWKRIVENAKDSKVAKWIGKESFRWLIGNGNMKMFWEDIWLPSKEFLTRRGVQLRQLERGCSWCDKELESAKIGGLFWYPPRYVWVKFNVSGVANEDEAGCGGVLRNSNGVARVLFFSLVATKDSIAAEIGAIIIVLDVYLAICWKGKGSLIIEIGSNEVFSWIEKKRLRPWILQSIFKDIKNRMDKVGNISFLKAKKHRNEMASALALAGIKRPGMFKAWC
ncbi:hypothetical protein Goshw_001440 [Gossypium schwendimanii]|uniref:RNase H type-1 domain-containing protein n=1 Tax=Gossypium schwendimanii TaxID=34291 RepID=A0A7J9LZU1_GOSSC|nr:hypothetical protein [Gossypium schwendimanii]